ncbi:MAG: DNA polymerase III subunit delta [Nitrospirae bacterium]|nr:DNA polymerase III subunit delta [Nitrospirota bacterium]MBI3393810.1 DNA polymerase III subunit delta [Nitrospirota bacterium]
MKAAEFNALLDKGAIPGVLLLHGPEAYLRDRVLARLKSAVLGNALVEFNLETFYGREAQGEEILQSWRTLPFGAPRRLVIVRDVEKINAAGQELLAEAMDAPEESACLVLVAEKADFRKKLFVAARSRGAEVSFMKPFEREMPGYARRMAQERGLVLSEGAVARIVEEAGEDLLSLAGEIEKLSLVSASGRPVSEEEAARWSGRRRAASVFKVIGDAASGRLPEALAGADRLAEEGEEPIKVLSLLARQMRLYALSDDLVRGNVPRQEIPRRLGMAPMFSQEFMVQADCIGSRAAEFLRPILDGDVAVKRGAREPMRVVEQLLARVTLASLCGKGGKKRDARGRSD